MEVKLLLLLTFFVIILTVKYLERYDENEYLRDIIVKIYSQNIKFDYIEPYKNYDSYESIGTGFFISKDIILTASHVVQDSIRLDITIPSIGKKKFKTEVICFNPYYDFALLKSSEINSKEYLKFGNSNKIRSGDKVMAIGYPLAQDKLKFTSGIISGIHDGEIQTDAPINPGNSGGPLLNEKKEVIGINVSGYRDADNIGYAVPINRYKLYQDDMLNSKNKISFKPILGGSYVNTNQEMLDYNNIKDDEGILIKSVFKNGPLDKSGIKAGDIISEFDNHDIDRYGEVKVDWFSEKMSFKEIFNDYKVNDQVNIKYYRDGKVKNTKLKIDSIKFYKIRDVFPQYETVDYIIISGMIFSDMRLKHLDKIDNESMYKFYLPENQLEDKIIITDIMKGSYVNNLDILNTGLVLSKVNDINVNNCKELLKNFKKIKKNEFITFEFDNGIKLVLRSNKIQEEDKFLSKEFNYNIQY